WIMNMRADRVLDGRGEPANDGVTHILRRPIRIVRGWIHWDDGVLESSGLERRLPIENRLSHPRLPLIGRRRIDVVDDRLDRLRQNGVGIFFLQPIARYVRTIGGSLLGRPEIHLRNREEPHAL